MFSFDDTNSHDFIDHDTAVLLALEKTEKGLFDPIDSLDEDVAAMMGN